MTHPFTDQYIAMARAAEEIQAMRADGDDSYQLGDWFLGVCGPELLDQPTIGWGVCQAWIPRFDQLIRMLGSYGAPDSFARFAFAFPPEYGGLAVIRHPFGQAEDWHELALAVVMCQRFWKRWDGEKWVPAK